MSEDMPESFRDHLDRASATVATWPEWKRNLLGKPSRKENVKMSETEKAPWQAAFEKKYRKAYWDRLPETSKMIKEVVAEKPSLDDIDIVSETSPGLTGTSYTLRRLSHNPRKIQLANGWLKHKARLFESVECFRSYQQGILDVLRLQRREAKIAAMEAKPKQYNSVQDMVDATSPELSQEFRDRKPNGERIRELTEDNADRLTEAEIRAAIDAKQEDFLMRLQRWEKTKATVVGAVMEEEPCSYCNAEPSSFKVETLPHETTWREVAEAVEAAGAEFAYEIGCDGWKCRVETIPCDSIDEALERLRDMAETETKPEPITPDAIWENEIYGFGYEELPTWVREAIKAEVERRNAKGGE